MQGKRLLSTNCRIETTCIANESRERKLINKIINDEMPLDVAHGRFLYPSEIQNNSIYFLKKIKEMKSES